MWRFLVHLLLRVRPETRELDLVRRVNPNNVAQHLLLSFLFSLLVRTVVFTMQGDIEIYLFFICFSPRRLYISLT